MSEGDANRVSLGNVDLSQSATSNTGDLDKAIFDLKKQILALQSENSSLKRQIPRMKDMEGNDVTENLCDDLAKAEQGNEHWQNKYAESEQKLSRFQCKMQSELDALDTQITQLKSRAKSLEEDNEKLRKQADNDKSKIYHLQNDADITEHHDLSLGAFEQSFEPDSVSQIRQELAEKIEENAKLSEQVDKTKKVVEKMEKYISALQAEGAERMKLRDTHDDDSLFALPKVGTLVDSAIANMLFILQQLDSNKCDQNVLRDDIIDLMRKHGYDNNPDIIAELSKDCETTFRTKFNNRRSQIKRTNNELANEYRLDNTELADQLNQLSNDSVFSSSAAFGQQVSFAMDLGKNTLTVEVLNKTIDVAQDLGTVVARMNDLRGICNQLFDKLRGTALFLQNLLDTLEDNEEGRELLRKINDIKMDLDRSMVEARSLVNDVEKAEKSVAEYHGILQQTIVNQTTEENSLIQEEVTQETASADAVNGSKLVNERLKSVEVQCESLKVHLNKEIAHKESLNSNYLELKKQKEEDERKFKQDIQAVLHKMAEEKEKALHLQKSLEEKNQFLENLQIEIKAKDDELVEVNQKLRRLIELLAESNESINLVRSQLAALTNSYQCAIVASSEKQNELNGRMAVISQMEEEIGMLKNEREALIKRVQINEAELSSVCREIAVVAKEKAALEAPDKKFTAPGEKRDSLIVKGDGVTYEAMKNIDESPQNSFTECPDEDGVSDFDHFSKFFEDCSQRSNKLVQMVKMVKNLVTNDIFVRMLDEARSIRWLLYKGSRFIESQKENFGNCNKKLGRDIREELKNIYNTLQFAAQTSQSKVAAIKRESPAGTRRK